MTSRWMFVRFHETSDEALGKKTGNTWGIPRNPTIFFGLFWFGINPVTQLFGIRGWNFASCQSSSFRHVTLLSIQSFDMQKQRQARQSGAWLWPVTRAHMVLTPWNTKKKRTRNEYPLGNDHISHLGKRKIIDSKVPAGRGYGTVPSSCCSWKILIACIFRGIPGKIHKGQQIRIWSNKEAL